ncbi:hypothetical protein M0R04_12440 [Candidatus Dojkabacteria bacterium]|jgi:hypothetical protein|nr:hypothetical protein [Candidatus Dojkabacteria bacterium]
MALKSLLSRFRSISRPSLSGGSSSGYSALAKKTQAAEDAIVDNQYEAGDLSPEYYLNTLQKRYLRTTITPLQKVNLLEKINNVRVTVTDADVSRKYASGELTTGQILGYEKEKLKGMTEPGSAAYIKQQQKVQGFQDKLEKEARTQTRIAENLRISRMPEDTSANLWSKAQLYQTLSEQARIDGDIQQADTLLTQANNYSSSAKKADVNDIITGARLSVSETPNAGLGVPSSSADVGAMSPVAKGSPISGGSTAMRGGVSQTTPSAVSTTNTGFGGFQTPAIKNALESLDRQQKTIDRLYQQKQDNETLVSRYQQAISQASGDQKTSLTISLNNLIESGKGIDNQIDNTTANVNDTIVRIQELQTKASLSNFKQEIRINNNNFDKAEDELEVAFKKGQISKYEYIQKGVMLAETKVQFQSQASDVFNQYGDDSSAETYLQKSTETQKVHEQLINVNDNIDDFEPLAVEPGGKITNLFGKTMKPGEVALTNVRTMKDSGIFQRQYAAKDGKFFKVNFPAEITDKNGDLLPAYLNKDLSIYNDKSFIYQTDVNGKIIGKDNPDSQIKFATINDIQRPFIGTLHKKMQDIGSITQDENGSWIQTPSPKGVSKLTEVLAKVQGFAQDFFNRTPQEKPLFKPATFGKQPVYGKQVQMQSVNPAISSTQPTKKTGFKLPSLVSEVQASDLIPEGVPGSVGNIIDKVAEEMRPGDMEFKKVLHAIALAESGGRSNAKGDGGWSIGLFQNHRRDGRGKGYSVEQLEDPEFNTRLSAKELVRYYDQAVSKGLTGSKMVAYVSKYGQRPAPGNENQAAAKYGQFVNKAIGNIKSGIDTSKAVGNYKNMSGDLPDERRLNNIALALGGKPGQYRSDLKDKQDQGAIDRGFRGDKAQQDLLRSEGFKPSSEMVSVSTPSQPMASIAPKQQSAPQQNNFVQNAYNSVSNAAKNISSGVQNWASNIKIPQISIPKFTAPKIATPVVQKPNIVQQTVSKIQSNPTVQKVSGFVNKAISSISNWFKKK